MAIYNPMWAFPQYSNATSADLYRQICCASFLVAGELLNKLSPNKTWAAQRGDPSGAIAVLDYGHEWPTLDFVEDVQAVVISCRFDPRRTMFLHFNLGSMLPPKQVANTARSALGRQEWARWVEPVLGSLSARVQSVQPARMHQAYWQRYHYDLISQERDKMPELCASDELPPTLRGAKSCHPHCGQGPQFLLLGGSVREWKISVLLELARRDLLSHGRFSSGTHPVCEDSNPSARCDFPDVVSSDTCRRLFSNASLVRAVCAMLPRALDLPLARDTATIVAMERSTARDLWRDADFGLVFETTMYPFEGTVPSSFVTEKMLKPIFNARPFLSLGSIGELATLRALGFRTFEPFINESYDQIPNPDARMRAVLDETERLLSMRRDQWRRTAQGLSEAALHNARHVYCGGYMRTMQAHVLDTIEYAFLASADTQTRAGTNA